MYTNFKCLYKNVWKLTFFLIAIGPDNRDIFLTLMLLSRFWKCRGVEKRSIPCFLVCICLFSSGVKILTSTFGPELQYSVGKNQMSPYFWDRTGPDRTEPVFISITGVVDSLESSRQFPNIQERGCVWLFPVPLLSFFPGTYGHGVIFLKV